MSSACLPYLLHKPWLGGVIYSSIKKKKIYQVLTMYHVPNAIWGPQGATMKRGEKFFTFEEHPFLRRNSQ